MAADKDVEMLGIAYHVLVLQQLLTSGEAPDVAFVQRVMDEVFLPLSLALTT